MFQIEKRKKSVARQVAVVIALGLGLVALAFSGWASEEVGSEKGAFNVEKCRSTFEMAANGDDVITLAEFVAMDRSVFDKYANSDGVIVVDSDNYRKMEAEYSAMWGTDPNTPYCYSFDHNNDGIVEAEEVEENDIDFFNLLDANDNQELTESEVCDVDVLTQDC